ncbi:DUF1549 and DUF1553 domain-containing protein [Singulisphaera sp. Ch08]|uniref:DUF1549 and DUF1553 domain-containing protein n=1 Tax=Singulisphaera sp. Ch08 TaxID=3120278 RepID=A0AAU7CLQ4_9BACT
MLFRRAWVAVACLVALGPTSGAADVPAGRGLREPVASVRDAHTLAARIDAVLAARWAEAKIRPAAVADDGEFLRRVSLDLIGKIPTAAEARDFLDDPSQVKRQALVERLLDSPAYTTRATELWRQLLLPEADTEDQARVVAGSFEAWLRRKVVEEAGYDRIVREILTTKLNDRNTEAMASRLDPSPAAYYVAKEGKPENLAAGAARVFLGVRLECAQCHNHPFASWKRDDFWGFAAFFAGVPSQNPEVAAAVRAPREAAALRELTIPGTKKVVKAAHLDGSKPDWRPRAETREVLADWIIAPENPYFAKALVNRVWARFFGVGLIEPVDDLDLESDPEFGELVKELAVQFRLHDYNLKYLIRVLTATRAYNLSSVAAPGESTAPLFAYMPVRGLSPGQLFDSLSQATGADAAEARARFLDLFANREERATEAQTTILQALTMMNGSHIADATNPATGAVLGAVTKAPFLDTPGRIETLYLATLTRRPKPEERSLLVRYVDRSESPEDRAKALADVFWAILNGPEFHLNH